MESTEFPVGRLLNGDSYKTQTRIKNISSAMNWIQKQMESLRESDKQLLSLFSKLEADMVDLKSICSDSSRVRTASISSIGMTTDNSASSLRYIDSYQHPSKILEETNSDYQLERSSSNDSLENFADLLGEDDTEDDVIPRVSLKSQGSNLSYEFNSNFSLHDNDRISGAGDLRGLDDALSMTSQSSGSSTRLNVTNSSPHLSQQSNKSRSLYSSNYDNDSVVNVITDNDDNIQPLIPPPTIDSNLKASDTDKRLSGLAGEIFAILNMK